jgi:prevent-host-death family protein
LYRRKNMIQITISDFRQNLKKYAEIVKHEDIIVVSNGKPVMRISDPARNRVDEIRKLRGIAKTSQSSEEIMENKIRELLDTLGVFF